MEFVKIDLDTWGRSKSYKHFSEDVPCTHSMVVNINITKLILGTKKHRLKFFPAILYGISCIINSRSEFRMDLDEEQNIGFYEKLNPCYAIFHSNSETFTNVWTEYSPDFNVFYQSYKNDMEKYQNNKDSKPLDGKNIFNISCIPWVSFTGFSLNLQKGYDYFLPIFTIGKYFTDDKKILLPLAIQVNHAVCDGFHVARFVNELQQWVDSFLP